MQRSYSVTAARLQQRLQKDLWRIPRRNFWVERSTSSSCCHRLTRHADTPTRRRPTLQRCFQSASSKLSSRDSHAYKNLSHTLQTSVDEILEFMNEIDRGRLKSKWSRQVDRYKRAQSRSHTSHPKAFPAPGSLSSATTKGEYDDTVVGLDDSYTDPFADTFIRGLILLRCMSRKDFAAYDHLDDDEDTGDDTDVVGEEEEEEDAAETATETVTVTQQVDTVSLGVAVVNLARSSDPIEDIEVDLDDDDMEELEALDPRRGQNESAESPLEGQHFNDSAEHDEDGSGSAGQDIVAMMDTPTLDTSLFNILLLRLALASDMASDEMLEALMKAFQQMERLAAAGAEMVPDNLTYEIVLQALNKRLVDSKTGVRLVRGMMSKPGVWNQYSLMAAVELCERRNDLKLALAIVSDIKNNPQTSTAVPARAYQLLIQMAKKDDQIEKAATVVRLCLDEYLKYRGPSAPQHDIDAVLIDAIRWIDRNRSGQRVDNTNSIKKLMDVLEEFPTYKPGFSFWKAVIFASVKGTADNSARWHLVRDAFNRLSHSVPWYWPNHKLLLLGLEASEALRDPAFAADLVNRVARNGIAATSKPHISGGSDVELTTDLFSPVDLERAIIICLGDAEAMRSILENIFDLGDRIPALFQRRLYELGVKGYAANREADAAEALLLTLVDRGLDVSEEAFGAVIHAFAVDRQSDRALKMFYDMESGALSCPPGPASYNGMVLSHVLSHSCPDALELYAVMAKDAIDPLSATHHSALLATYRLFGKEKAVLLLDKLLVSNAHLTEQTYKLAAKIVLDLPGKAEALSSDSLSDRVLDEHGVDSKGVLRDIMGAWRMAEQKQERGASGSLAATELMARRRGAWSQFLTQLVRYTG